MSRGFNNKVTTINESLSKPRNESEMFNTVQQLSNAMRGVYGSGEWDGGVSGVGYYTRYAMFWDAKLVFSGYGQSIITFPFKLIDAVVRIIDAASGVQTVHYCNDTSTLQVYDLSGKTVVEVFFVQNTKE